MRREPVRALLIDFDGVLRHWDPAVATEVERRHSLPAGAFLTTLLRPELRRGVVTGELSHDGWMAAVAAALEPLAGGPEAAAAAVARWQRYRGEVDPVVLAFVREVRAAGRPVALATNASDRLDADLVELGLVGEFDAVVNSAALGVAKPARAYFQAACAAVGVPAAGVLLVDDTERCVLGARAAGLAAHRWTGPADLPYLRAALR